MSINTITLLALIFATILIAIRLPSYLARLGVPKNERIGAVLMLYVLLGLAWLVVNIVGWIG